MKTRTVYVHPRSPLNLEALEARMMLSGTTTALPVADAFPLVNNAQWLYADQENGQSEVGVANMFSTGANSFRLVESVSTHASTVFLTSSSSGIFATSAQASGAGTITFAGGLEFLPSVLTPGATFGGKVDTNAAFSAGGFSGTLIGQTKSTGKVVGWTHVVTAAGTYEAMRVTDTMSFTGTGSIAGFTAHGAVTLSFDMDLVPGIGIVAGARQLSSSGSAAGHSTSSSFSYTASLTSTNLPPPTGVDLTVQYSADTFPNPAVPGDKGNVTVLVTNQGETFVNSSTELDLYASPDQDPADGVLVTGGTLTGQAITLSDGQSQSFTFKNVRLPVLPSGQYFLVAVVNPTKSIVESNYANDTAASPQEIDFAFGAVGTRKNVILNLTQADGTNDTFAMSGPGTGTITEGINGWDLDVTGTTTASGVKVTTKMGLAASSGLQTLNDITVAGPLKTFSGAGVNLTGAMTVSGSLGTLTLNNLSGDGGITLGGASTDKTTLTFNQVDDESLTTGSTITSFTAASWADSDADGDTITAPGLTKLTIKNGNLAANLGIGTGGIGTLSLTGGSLSGNIADAGALASLKVTGGGISGNIAATSEGTLAVTGGNVSGAISSTATAVALGKLSAIGKLTVTGGDITGNLNANGNVGAISAAVNMSTGLGGNASGTFNFGGNLASLTLSGWMQNGQLLTGGNITSVTVGGMQDSVAFAGVNLFDLTEQNGVWGLPSTLPALSGADSIGTFTIKGLKSGTTPLLSFINSNIAALKLGTVSLAYADGSNSGIPFGVACNQYAKLSYRDMSDKTTTWTKSNPVATLPGPDGVVRVITV